MKSTALGTLVLALLVALSITAQEQAELAVDEIVVQLREGPVPVPPPIESDQPTATAGEAGEEEAPPVDAATEPPTDAPPKSDVLKFHLMDGTIITGKLTTQAIPVKTEFGKLIVPIDAIQSFAPGLASHPEIDQKITQLINELGSPDAKKRDKAQAALQSYGPGLIPELQRFANDPDAERKVRIATILEELYSVSDDEFDAEQGPALSMFRLDQIVTEQFTVAGNIEQSTFNIKSKFGELVVKLQDIKGVERVRGDSHEIRKIVEISGTDMTCRAYKKTGIRVNRGDRIIISSDGRITMSPWGSNSVSGPDGIPQNGMYINNIPMGALAGRIGDSGEEFLVGSKNSFVAKKSGVLQLGFAMQANWANYQFPGKYETRIRVVPSQ